MTVASAALLRPVLPEDDHALRALHADVHGETMAQAGLDPAALATLIELQHVAQTRSYRDAFPDSTDHLVVVDGQVAGRCWVAATASEVRVLDLAVRPSCRRRGIATQVLREVQVTAARSGLPVVLQVWHDNIPAQQLYAGLGFVVRAAGDQRLTLEWRAP